MTTPIKVEQVPAKELGASQASPDRATHEPKPLAGSAVPVGIADAGDRYLILKRGLYFRPDDHGYTGLKREAGRYVASHACLLSGEKAVHENDAPEYSPACWEETKLADKDRQIAEARAQHHELLFAVARKHHGETRHETALRYIRERENSLGNGPAQAMSARQGHGAKPAIEVPNGDAPTPSPETPHAE
jgi:hypothetical protein